MNRSKALDVLFDWWQYDTRLLSSTTKMMVHPAGKAIEALSYPCLPYVFKRIEAYLDDIERYEDEQSGHPIHLLFLAVQLIAKSGPIIPESDRGKVNIIAKHYLKWGLDQGFHEKEDEDELDD